jgi:hypothetical protein
MILADWVAGGALTVLDRAVSLTLGLYIMPGCNKRASAMNL